MSAQSMACHRAAHSSPRCLTHHRACIAVNVAVCHGKPCIRGLRYPVENVLEWLASGMTIDEILADYEDLERADILAVLGFAARLAHVKRIERLAAEIPLQPTWMI